jgi:DNA-binding CsgD family transcriptional regulator
MLDQILTGLDAIVIIIDFDQNRIIWSNKHFKQIPIIAKKAMMEYIPMVFRNIYSAQPIYKIENNIKILESQKSEDGSYTTVIKVKSSKQVWNWVVCKSYIREEKGGKPVKIGVISLPVQFASGFKRVADGNNKRHQNSELAVLTKKEQLVLKHIVDGMTNKEISEKYFISIYTVQTHRKRILKKLAVKNTAELINYVVKNNLIK